MPVSLQWLSEIVTSSCHMLVTGVGSEWPRVSLGEWNPGEETAGHGQEWQSAWAAWLSLCRGHAIRVSPCKGRYAFWGSKAFLLLFCTFLSSSTDLIIFPKISNKKMEVKNKPTPALLKVQDPPSHHVQRPSHSHSNECHEVPKAAFYSFKDSWKESQPLDAA